MTANADLKLRKRAEAHDIAGGQDAAERGFGRRTYHFRVEADAAASTLIAERSLACFPVEEFPDGVKVVDVEFRSSVAVTESASVYATDTLRSRDSAGVTPLVASTLTTDTVANAGIGTTVAHKTYAGTLSATLANRVIPADGVLTLQRAKESTGTQLPECVYSVTVELL